jgi:hypothetical protein
MPADRLAYGDGTLWAYGQEATWTSWLDPQTRAHHAHPIQTIGQSVYNNPGLTFAFGATWIVSPNGRLYEYSRDGQQQTANIPAGSYDITKGARWLWITGTGGTLARVNPFTNTVHVYHLGHPLAGVGYTNGRLWVAVSK